MPGDFQVDPEELGRFAEGTLGQAQDHHAQTNRNLETIQGMIDHMASGIDEIAGFAARHGEVLAATAQEVTQELTGIQALGQGANVAAIDYRGTDSQVMNDLLSGEPPPRDLDRERFNEQVLRLGGPPQDRPAWPLPPHQPPPPRRVQEFDGSYRYTTEDGTVYTTLPERAREPDVPGPIEIWNPETGEYDVYEDGVYNDLARERNRAEFGELGIPLS